MICKSKIENMFDGPNEQQIIHARKELGEDDDRLRHVEELLHNWLENHLNLRGNYDKNIARNYLRGSKHNLQTTKARLQSYFLTKHSCPELFTNRNPICEEIRRTFDKVHLVPLPQLTEKGERIWFISLTDLEINFNMAILSKIIFMLYDLLMLLESPINGEILVLDGRNFTASDSVNFFSPAFRNFVSVARNAYAIRLKQIHIINAPPMVDKLLVIIKPLLHEKIKKRFIVHSSYDSLLNCFPSRILPSDYKGESKSLKENARKWQELMMDFSDWFREQESVKITQQSQSLSFGGVDGSFRKLTID